MRLARSHPLRWLGQRDRGFAALRRAARTAIIMPAMFAERAIGAAADARIDADALAEHLQRQGAGAFTVDWAALRTAIKEKAAEPTT